MQSYKVHWAIVAAIACVAFQVINNYYISVIKLKTIESKITGAHLRIVCSILKAIDERACHVANEYPNNL